MTAPGGEAEAAHLLIATKNLFSFLAVSSVMLVFVLWLHFVLNAPRIMFEDWCLKFNFALHS